MAWILPQVRKVTSICGCQYFCDILLTSSTLATCHDFFGTGWYQYISFRVVTKLHMTFREVLGYPPLSYHAKWCVDPTRKDAQWGMYPWWLVYLKARCLYNLQVWIARSNDIRKFNFTAKLRTNRSNSCNEIIHESKSPFHPATILKLHTCKNGLSKLETGMV